jgi:hypothetical protein
LFGKVSIQLPSGTPAGLLGPAATYFNPKTG